MSDSVRKQPPRDGRDGARASAPPGMPAGDDFAREKTRFFGGSALAWEDEHEPGWERDGTRFSSRPRTTDDFSPDGGYRAAEETPSAGSAIEWGIDPDEFGASDGLPSTEFEADPEPDHAAASPTRDAGGADLVDRLRRGDFTDPSIRIDEFDEFADTVHLDPDELDYDVPVVTHVRPPEPPEGANRGLARRFIAEISARIEHATRRRHESNDRPRQQNPDAAPRRTLDELLSDYLGRKP